MRKRSPFHWTKRRNEAEFQVELDKIIDAGGPLQFSELQGPIAFYQGEADHRYFVKFSATLHGPNGHPSVPIALRFFVNEDRTHFLQGGNTNFKETSWGTVAITPKHLEGIEGELIEKARREFARRVGTTTSGL